MNTYTITVYTRWQFHLLIAIIKMFSETDSMTAGTVNYQTYYLRGSK
jgi:hypothetical protein